MSGFGFSSFDPFLAAHIQSPVTLPGRCAGCKRSVSGTQWLHCFHHFRERWHTWWGTFCMSVVKCLGETLNTVWCHIMHFNKDQKTDASHLFTHRDTHRYTHNRPERGEADVKVPFTTTPSASLARSLYIVPAKLLTTWVTELNYRLLASVVMNGEQPVSRQETNAQKGKAQKKRGALKHYKAHTQTPQLLYSTHFLSHLVYMSSGSL